MNALKRVVPTMLVLGLAAACAQTTVTSRDAYMGERLARPNRILVHNFAASNADIPPGSAVAGQYAAHSTPQTQQEIQVGRELGAKVARELVADIQKMGLPAVLAAGQPPAQVGDIVFMGYFESVDQGDAAKRIVLGFGSGAADLKTAVEGYLMTDKGLRRLGSGTVDAGTGKAPGVAVPLVVAAATGNPIGLIVSSAVKAEGQISGRTTIDGAAKRTADLIAEQLRGAFQRQGWI
jgi:hypothetical protein